jgi:SAM-dependent methyltransferase
MRLIDTKRLDDGKGFNQGQPSRLIQIESPADYDQLEANIHNTDYYGKLYFQTRISHEAGQIKPANLLVAALLGMLRPRAVLELGCGRGDILLLLHLSGVAQTAGIDISQEVVKSMWPQVAGDVHLGDLLQFCAGFAKAGRSFDTVVALDIWEHLHPAKLGDYIAAVLGAASDDALFYFNIPAFGDDRGFGEVFPLEYEENRAALAGGQPFSHLLADQVDPPIPVNGHLIWAGSDWWEAQFARHGLVRAVELEARLHALFDDHLFYAQRAFFIFHRGEPAAARLTALAAQPWDQMAKARALAELLLKVAALQAELGRPVMEAEKTLLDINHALGLAGPGQRARAELLARLLRGRTGSQGKDRPWGDYLVVDLLKQTLHDDLIRLQETLYEGAERMAASWFLPPGLGLRQRVFRGLARRSFERYRARLLG